MTREFRELSGYSNALLGKCVEKISFNPDADEGLAIYFNDGAKLKFGFSGGEGTIEIFRSASMPEPSDKDCTNPALIMPPKYAIGQRITVPVKFSHNDLRSLITCEGEITGIKNRGSTKQGSVWYVYDVFIAKDGSWDTVAVNESEVSGE